MEVVFGGIAAVAAVVASFVAVLDWRGRRRPPAAVEGETDDEPMSSEDADVAEARAVRERRWELREDAVLLALRASTAMAAAAGDYVEGEMARARAFGRLRAPTNADPMKEPVRDVSQALDEIRYLGPQDLADAMGNYFDCVLEVRDVALTATGDVQAAVNDAGRRMYEAKVRLVEVANRGGLEVAT